MIVTLQTQALQTLEQVRALWRATQRFPFQRKSALARWRSQSAGRTWAHLFDQGAQVVFGGGYRSGFHRAVRGRLGKRKKRSMPRGSVLRAVLNALT